MSLDSLIAEVAPDLPGCPDSLVRRYLRDAYIELVRETGAVQKVHQTGIVITGGQSEFALDIPADTKLNYIFNVRIDGQPIGSMTDEQQVSGGNVTGEKPKAFVMNESEDGIILLPTPPANYSGTMEVLFAVYPLRSVTDVPDEILNLYYDVLVAGCRYRAMVTPGQVWTNLQLASHYKGEFYRGVSRAKLDRIRGAVNYRARVITRGFF